MLKYCTLRVEAVALAPRHGTRRALSGEGRRRRRTADKAGHPARYPPAPRPPCPHPRTTSHRLPPNCSPPPIPRRPVKDPTSQAPSSPVAIFGRRLTVQIPSTHHIEHRCEISRLLRPPAFSLLPTSSTCGDRLASRSCTSTQPTAKPRTRGCQSAATILQGSRGNGSRKARRSVSLPPPTPLALAALTTALQRPEPSLPPLTPLPWCALSLVTAALALAYRAGAHTRRTSEAARRCSTRGGRAPLPPTGAWPPSTEAAAPPALEGPPAAA